MLGLDVSPAQAIPAQNDKQTAKQTTIIRANLLFSFIFFAPLTVIKNNELKKCRCVRDSDFLFLIQAILAPSQP